MNNSIFMDSLLEFTYTYLTKFRYCSVHKLVHTGRYAYALTLGLSLGKSLEELQIIASFLISQLNFDSKLSRIYPGNAKRRNYSTDAIDIGICVDSISRYWVKFPPKKSDFRKISFLVENRLCRLAEKSSIPNQQLWAAVGLAQFSQLSLISASQSEKYKKICTVSVQSYLNSIASDGYSPYYSKNVYLDGHSPYYHARCLAFCLRIFDILELEFSEKEKVSIANSVNYMVRICDSKGDKNPLIDSKRYYFIESRENYSQVFEYYVLSHRKIIDLKISGTTYLLNKIQLKLFGLTQELHANTNEVLNKTQTSWQCDYMGLSYFAWLSFVENLQTNSTRKSKVASINPPTSGASLYKISLSELTDFYLVAKKTPLGFATGGICSGIIISKGEKGSFLLNYKFPLHFSDSSMTLYSFKMLTLKLLNDFPIIRLLFRELVIDRKRFSSLKFLLQQLLIYCRESLKISTRFATHIDVEYLENGVLSHALYLCDINGKKCIHIGARFIELNRNGLSILDVLLPSHKFRNIDLTIPGEFAPHITYVKK